MKSLLKRIFIDNWPRKLVSLILAIIIWFVTAQSLSVSRTITGVGVRIVHLPEDMTVDGMQDNGLLRKRTTLIVNGNRNELSELTANDIELIIDARDHQKPWVETISKAHIMALNPETNISGINRVIAKSIVVKPRNLYREKIPIIVTQPIGEAPRGFQFLDIWPYQLNINVSGPEEKIKQLKTRGVKLTFNLSDISRRELESLSDQTGQDVTSFSIPKSWKKVYIPELSEHPISIDDPDSQYLRIDFVKRNLIPLKEPVQIGLFYPITRRQSTPPSPLQIASTPIVRAQKGVSLLSKHLYARGVSNLFVDVIKRSLKLEVILKGKGTYREPSWSLQYINPRELEDHYVSMIMSDVTDKNESNLLPQVREEYLRNRFRHYMNHMELCLEDGTPLKLKIALEGSKVLINENSDGK